MNLNGNARDLLAKLQSANLSGGSGALGMGDDDEGFARSGLGDRRNPSNPSSLSRLKKQTSVAGRATSMFHKAKKTTTEDKQLKMSKTDKGSIVAGAVMKVSKKADGGWQERFVLVVGDVVCIFLLAAQPDIPLGLRMWPEYVVCLNQSQLGLEGAKPEVATSGNESAFILQSVQDGMGAQALLSDYGGTMERLATAMHLGVQNVRRSRQQAKLSHSQQMCHEKKLSLLKTQHMIELLYKSQETFFEAGGDQFDNCNAVCMHSGVMRQSLIDVTPFMPVSDFICEYCSQVIVLEEQADATEEEADAGELDHEEQLKREHAKKARLDEEALMVARDVRVLRQRRRLAEEEAAGAWQNVEKAIHSRQQTELQLEELKLRQRISTMTTKTQLDEVRAQLYEEVALATKQCDTLSTQLEDRQTRQTASRPSADGDPEEEMKRKMSFGNKASRALSFNSKKKRGEAAAGGAGGEGAAACDAPPELKKGSSGGIAKLGRSMSFSRQKAEGGVPAAAPSGAAAVEPTPELKKGASSGGLMRSLSFKRTGSSEPGGLKKTQSSEGVAKEPAQPPGQAPNTNEPAQDGPKNGRIKASLIRSMSFSKQKAEKQRQPSEGAEKPPTEKPPPTAPNALVRKISFGRKKAESS